MLRIVGRGAESDETPPSCAASLSFRYRAVSKLSRVLDWLRFGFGLVLTPPSSASFRTLTPSKWVRLVERTQLAFPITYSWQIRYASFKWVRFGKKYFYRGSHPHRRSFAVGRDASPCPESFSGRGVRSASSPPQLFSNNYRPYTTTATPRPAKISVFDKRLPPCSRACQARSPSPLVVV